jgi:peptidyl-dipeptidase A
LDGAARAFLREVEDELRPLTIAVSLAHWKASTTGTEASLREATERETRLRKFLSSGARLEKITELLTADRVDDALERRQLELLALEHRANRLPEPVIDDLVQRSNAIQAEFYNFRGRLEGREVTNNEILEVLRGERRLPLRRSAWEASKQIAPRVAGPLLELVERRNAAARSLGYRDYYAMHLELQEIDEPELFGVFGDLRDATEAPFRAAKRAIDERLAARYGIVPDELRPWHYEDPFFQEVPLSDELGITPLFRGRDLPEIAAVYFEGIGLPIRDVLERSDLYERPGKDQHAYCTDIDREGDIRLLCNVRDDAHWMGVLLHELGHAAYDKFIPRSLPWLLREYAHIATTEAIAMFMGRLIRDVDWLEGATGSRLADREDLARQTVAASRFGQLLTARWVLVMTYFERALYADPRRADLSSYWWDLVEELQLLPRPEGRDAPDWAAKIHLAVAPVYYHNYLLGELIASQIGAAARREIGPELPPGFVGCQQLGTFLRERIFAHGASLHWQTLLERASGSRLSPQAFLDEFVVDRQT